MYNQQHKQLFDNQLSKPFGPEELVEIQETRIEEARDSFLKKQKGKNQKENGKAEEDIN